ncbi:MAG: ADYC domain-containing protein [Nannocystaceae bacterium]
MELRSEQNNAPVLNSSRLNGNEFNGFTLNGGAFNGFTLNGFTLNGVDLDDISLDGSEFVGYRSDSGEPVEVRGTAMIGTQIRLMYQGHMYILTFDDVYPDPANPSGDVYFHEISVYDVDNDVTSPLCTIDNQAAPVIPLQHAWNLETGDRINNPNLVTFACHGAVLAKCVEWGYRPWATGTKCDSQGQNCTSVDLLNYHQACTRLARADYCGDGTAHTQNGTLIDVYDALNPHIQAQMTGNDPNWGVEAEWGPDGATCIGSSTRMQLLDDLEIAYETPPCLEDLEEQPACGTFPTTRPTSLLGNSYCSDYGTNPENCQ